MGEKKTYRCPNTSCKTTFTTPLKTVNLQDNPTEPYYACPFCLTKIDAPELKNKENNQLPATQKPAEPSKEQTSHGSSGKPAACQFHLGYLSERTNKEIPDDCLVCKDIVTCMLQKMRE